MIRKLDFQSFHFKTLGVALSRLRVAGPLRNVVLITSRLRDSTGCQPLVKKTRQVVRSLPSSKDDWLSVPQPPVQKTQQVMSPTNVQKTQLVVSPPTPAQKTQLVVSPLPPIQKTQLVVRPPTPHAKGSTGCQPPTTPHPNDSTDCQSPCSRPKDSIGCQPRRFVPRRLDWLSVPYLPSNISTPSALPFDPDLYAPNINKGVSILLTSLYRRCCVLVREAILTLETVQ